MESLDVETVIDNNRAIFKTFIDSPQDLVFEAWSSHEHLAHWWGPDGFTITTHSLDFSNGGIWKFIMHGPDGRDYNNQIQFIEINKPNFIIYKHLGEEVGAEGVRFQTKVIFEEVSGGTNLEIEMEFSSKKELERVAREYGAIEGAEQHIKRLSKYIDTIK